MVKDVVEIHITIVMLLQHEQVYFCLLLVGSWPNRGYFEQVTGL